jgi:hypothetical protein
MKIVLSFREKLPILNDEMMESDEFNSAYAVWISARTKFKIRYQVLTECDFFHGSVRGLTGNLSELCTGRNFVRRPSWLDAINETNLLDKIPNDPEASDGFVVIEGGVEGEHDNASLTTGFCLARSRPSLEDLGPVAMTLAKEQASLKRRKGESDCLHEERVDKKARQDLEKRCLSEYTLLRKSFRGVVSLPVENFRF